MKIGDRVIVKRLTFGFKDTNKGTILEIRKVKSNGYTPEYLISVDNARTFVWTADVEMDKEWNRGTKLDELF